MTTEISPQEDRELSRVEKARAELDAALKEQADAQHFKAAVDQAAQYKLTTAHATLKKLETEQHQQRIKLLDELFASDAVRSGADEPAEKSAEEPSEESKPVPAAFRDPEPASE
ncbi:MAG: hypothetical protein R3F02_18625 [Thiolinea sp.]